MGSKAEPWMAELVSIADAMRIHRSAGGAETIPSPPPYKSIKEAPQGAFFISDIIRNHPK
jgi:hypothetical protein